MQRTLRIQVLSRQLSARALASSPNRVSDGSSAWREIPRPDHLTRTADEPRQELLADACIVHVREETPTVRELILEVKSRGFTFLPGNWVDFHIDGVSKVGGYSICSTPAELPRLRLAIKRSEHPPAAWCHSHAVLGAHVRLKVGGKFQWSAAADGAGLSHLLLIAGGVGINPLYSIFQAAVGTSPECLQRLSCISLLYSAQRPSELAYYRHIEEIALADKRTRVKFHVTRNIAPEEPWEGKTGRISSTDLAHELAAAGTSPSDVLAYVCGPPNMRDEFVDKLCVEIGVPRQNVRSENWW